tara:strand:+ start:995 stop:1426 length:432 start_codon:yes stop_codon:yes gene_type:complete
MRTVMEIKLVLDNLYGFNIMTKSRVRKYSYARKVLTVLASNHGHTNEEIFSNFQIPHDTVIYNHKTIHNIKKIDMYMYNRCVDRLNLKMKKILTLKSLSSNQIADDIHEVLCGMGRKDLMYFKSSLLEPFLKKIDFERSIIDL